MRVQTQLDKQRLKKLRYLTETTHASASEVIRQTINFYYTKINVNPPNTADILINSGFVGCGESSPELSTTYKSELNHLLEQKHGDR